MTQDWPVVIVGIGNLGHALANYSGFRSRGFRVVALLDADPERHQEVVAGVDVRPFDDLEQIVAEQGVAIGVIATPAVAAQDVADRMVAAGISSILNFAPTVLVVPDGVDVRKVDLSIELQILAYHEQRKAQSGPRSTPHERPRRRHLPPLRPGLRARAGGRRRRGCGQAAPRRRGRRARHRGRRHRDLQPPGGLRRRRPLPRQRRGAVRAAGRARGPGHRGPAAAPLRPLRRRRGLAPVPGGGRARLDGGRRGPDPRPGA